MFVPMVLVLSLKDSAELDARVFPTLAAAEEFRAGQRRQDQITKLYQVPADEAPFYAQMGATFRVREADPSFARRPSPMERNLSTLPCKAE